MRPFCGCDVFTCAMLFGDILNSDRKHRCHGRFDRAYSATVRATGGILSGADALVP